MRKVKELRNMKMSHSGFSLVIILMTSIRIILPMEQCLSFKLETTGLKAWLAYSGAMPQILLSIL